MAEGILKDQLEKEDRTGIHVSSAGTWGLEGEEAAGHAISVCRDKGLDISGHRARRITEGMIRAADLLVVMEFEHFHTVLELFPEADRKTRMLTQFGADKNYLYDPIPDPYGRSRRQYVRCYEQIEKHIRILVREVFGDQDPDN